MSLRWLALGCSMASMVIGGSIRPLATTTNFSREAWCEFIGRRPELCRLPPKDGCNPYTGEKITDPSQMDSVHVLCEGRAVGHASWSLSGEAQIDFCGLDVAIPLMHQLAMELGGAFHVEWKGVESLVPNDGATAGIEQRRFQFSIKRLLLSQACFAIVAVVTVRRLKFPDEELGAEFILPLAAGLWVVFRRFWPCVFVAVLARTVFEGMIR